MALHILPGADDQRSQLGSVIGTGLGQGINALIQGKVKEMSMAKGMKQLQGLGFTPQQSQVLEYIKEIDPGMYTQYLGRALENMPSGAPASAQQMAAMAQLPAAQAPAAQGQEAALQRPAAQIAAPVTGKGLFEKGLTEKEKEQRFKETKDYRTSILEARKAARSDLKDLTRLEELSESGKLDTPGYVEMLKNAGFDIPALMNPESEEFAKIQQNFLKNAKQYFGGRISNYEVEQFLKTIPSLSQSPEGRKRVIANLKYMSRASEQYYKAYEDVLKKHGGVPPYDVAEEVERIIDPRLEKLAQQFKKDLARPVPKGQNKFITALMASAGHLVPAVTKGVESVATGIGHALPIAHALSKAAPIVK